MFPALIVCIAVIVLIAIDDGVPGDPKRRKN